MDERYLSRVLEDSLNEIFSFSADTLKFVQVNRGARENLGFSMDELRHLTPVDIKPEFSEDSFQKLISPLRLGVVPKLQFETVHQRKDGTQYPVEVHLQYSNYNRMSRMTAIIHDISDRKKSENELRM